MAEPAGKTSTSHELGCRLQRGDTGLSKVALTQLDSLKPSKLQPRCQRIHGDWGSPECIPVFCTTRNPGGTYRRERGDATELLQATVLETPPPADPKILKKSLFFRPDAVYESLPAISPKLLPWRQTQGATQGNCRKITNQHQRFSIPLSFLNAWG